MDDVIGRLGRALRAHPRDSNTRTDLAFALRRAHQYNEANALFLTDYAAQELREQPLPEMDTTAWYIEMDPGFSPTIRSIPISFSYQHPFENGTDKTHIARLGMHLVDSIEGTLMRLGLQLMMRNFGDMYFGTSATEDISMKTHWLRWVFDDEVDRRQSVQRFTYHLRDQLYLPRE
jgi:hypothetical protein